MSLPETVDYLWLVQQALLTLRIDIELQNMIHQATWPMSWLPADLYGLWFARILGGGPLMLLRLPLPIFGGSFWLRRPAGCCGRVCVGAGGLRRARHQRTDDHLADVDVGGRWLAPDGHRGHRSRAASSPCRSFPTACSLC